MEKRFIESVNDFNRREVWNGRVIWVKKLTKYKKGD